MASCIVASSAIVAKSFLTVSTKPASSCKAVSISIGTIQKADAMQVWTFLNNKFFETFSFLPSLSDNEITRQVDYIVCNGWTPTLEFSAPEHSYVSSEHATRVADAATVNYFDNRYWTMWKLPMFGCTDGAQILKEVSGCTKAFPGAYVRLVAFDNDNQVQYAGFLVHSPAESEEFR